MSYFNNNNNNLGGNGQRRNGPSPGGHGPYDPDGYHDNSDIYSQYSQPSFVSNNNNNTGNNLTNRYQANGPPPSSYTPAPTSYPAASYNAASYTPGPTSYNTPGPGPGPGDYFAPSQAPTAIQPRPSFSSSHHPYQDYDDTKSYASSANLNKEWGGGQVVPPVPSMPIQYPPRNQYSVSPSAYAAPQTPGGTAHWHQVRNQLMERRVVKQVPLINGNLVMDVPVPKGCITGQGGLGAMPDEMDKMRYSAATCDPDDFMRKKFSLRPYLFGRKTELFVSSLPQARIGVLLTTRSS